VLVDGVTVAMSVSGSCRGWQRASRAQFSWSWRRFPA